MPGFYELGAFNPKTNTICWDYTATNHLSKHLFSLVNNPVKNLALSLGFRLTIYGDHIEQLCGWVELQAGQKLITPDIEVMSFSTRRGSATLYEIRRAYSA